MEQKFITDKAGNKKLPITHLDAVRDSQGNTLTSLLGAMEDETDEKIQEAITTRFAPTYVARTKSLVFDINAPTYSPETKSLVFD